MTVVMNKKNFEGFKKMVLGLFVEQNITKFSIEELNKIAVRNNILDSWEQKRAIQLLEDLEIVKSESSFMVVNIDPGKAASILDQMDGFKRGR